MAKLSCCKFYSCGAAGLAQTSFSANVPFIKDIFFHLTISRREYYVAIAAMHFVETENLKSQ